MHRENQNWGRGKLQNEMCREIMSSFAQRAVFRDSDVIGRK